MKRYRIDLGLVVFISCSTMMGCSHQALYTAMQKRQQHVCDRQPPAEAESCRRDNEKSYRDYERERSQK